MWTILVAFILIAFVVAFSVIIIKLNSKERDKERAELVGRFRQLALRHELSILEEEILHDLAIGLDYEKRKLVMVKRKNRNDYTSIVIDLDDVRSSEKREIFGRVYPEKYAVLKEVMTLEKIVLELQFEDGSEPLQISFYDFIENATHNIDAMKTKAKRWETLLARNKKNQVRKRA